MSHFVILANAEAGSSERDTIRETSGLLSENGTVSLRWTGPDDDLDALIAGLSPDTVVIAGGDGSIHHVVNSLHPEIVGSIPFGIIPVGTGNDLARGMGISLEPTAAAETLLTTDPAPVAMLAGPNGEWAANNAHVGVGVAAARRGTDWKGFLGRLAYPAGALFEAVDFEGVDCVVNVDDTEIFDGDALTVMILLGSSAGGGFEVGTVSVTDPMAEVLVIEAGSMGARARAGAAIVSNEGSEESHGVFRVMGSTMTIETAGDVDGEIDGEFRTWSSPIEFRVVPEAWRLIVDGNGAG